MQGLTEAVDGLKSAHEAWTSGITQKAWDDKLAEAPRRVWWDAIDTCLATFATASDQHTADALIVAIPDAALHWCEPVSILADSIPAQNVDEDFPCRQVLGAVTLVIEAQPRLWPKTRPGDIADLAEQDVGTAQIAQMFGLQIHEIVDIIKDPSLYPEGHIPAEEVQRQEGRMRMRNRLKLAVQSHTAVMNVEMPRSPETTQQLLSQGVSHEQIRRMKTLDEMLADGIDRNTAAEIAGVEPEDIEEEAERLGFDAVDEEESKEDTEESIMSMIEQGSTRNEVMDRLGVSRQKIVAAIRRDKRAKDRGKDKSHAV
jgi:DNA-binding CsgD family transcriptional regulator